MAAEAPAIVGEACLWLEERYPWGGTWRVVRDEGNRTWQVRSAGGMIGYVELRPDGSLLQLRDRTRFAMPRQTQAFREALKA